MQGKTLRQFHHHSFLRDKKDFDKLVYLKIEFPYVPMDASSISRGNPFTKLQNDITVKGIRNEIKIQITEKKVPYICKYCNKKKIDAICKVNVRPKIK